MFDEGSKENSGQTIENQGGIQTQKGIDWREAGIVVGGFALVALLTGAASYLTVMLSRRLGAGVIWSSAAGTIGGTVGYAAGQTSYRPPAVGYSSPYASTPVSRDLFSTSVNRSGNPFM